MRLVISGATGRMGHALARLAAAEGDVQVIGGLDRARPDREVPGIPRVAPLEEASSILAEADVVTDFSAPPFLARLLKLPQDVLGRAALVIGTTGLGQEEHALVDGVARRLPVLTAANFSVGVNLLLALVDRAAEVLGPEFDVEITEAHHRRKEDAPSGTALALAEAVASGRRVELAAVRRDGRSGRPGARPQGEIGIHAVRGGEIVGDHLVQFIGDLERVEFAHHASDRDVFAAGALRAARWIAGKPAGRYTMRDVLGF